MDQFEYGSWNVLPNTLLNTYDENEPINLNIYFIPSAPAAAPSSDPTAPVPTPIAPPIIESYKVQILANHIPSTYKTDSDIDNGITFKADNSVGLFPISISYIEMDNEKIFNVKSFNDVPLGTNYQIFKYVPPNITNIEFVLIASVTLSNGIIYTSNFTIEVTTDLNTNVKALQEIIKQNSKKV